MKFSNLLRTFLVFLTCFCLFSFVPIANASTEQAVFAGGCFWCLEHDIEGLAGVLSVDSGYTGGLTEHPTYRNHKGHKEAVNVTYDSSKISFQELLKNYWINIDPFDSNGQFCDRGDSYQPVIYFLNDSQKVEATKSLEKVASKLSVDIDKIGVVVKPSNRFWLAEDYHQDFAKKNSIKYNFYRSACKRDNRLKEVWGLNAMEKFW